MPVPRATPRPSKTAAAAHEWQQGDIAFLMPAEAFSAPDYNDLLAKPPGRGCRAYIPTLATGHPVIVLQRAANHVLITPVPAYKSGPHNNYLAPWKPIYQQSKNTLDFRSFSGSELSSHDRPPLFLESGSMPKPKTSWVNIQSVWVVSLSVIGRFTKSRQLLRVREDSLSSLREHMAEKCARWLESQKRLAAVLPPASSLPSSSSSSSKPGPALSKVKAADPAPAQAPAADSAVKQQHRRPRRSYAQCCRPAAQSTTGLSGSRSSPRHAVPIRKGTDMPA